MGAMEAMILATGAIMVGLMGADMDMRGEGRTGAVEEEEEEEEDMVVIKVVAEVEADVIRRMQLPGF